MGERPIRVGCDIILEGDDAASLNVGDEVVLMRWGLVKLTKAAGGAFEGEKIDGDVKKKKTLSWLAETEDLVDVLLFVNRPTTNKQQTTPEIYKDQATLRMRDLGGEWLVDCVISGSGSTCED